MEIARQNAAEAGVTVAFRQGNASDMPFDDENFDLIVCCAAFNYFSDPVGALREMYRVLMPQGKALIIDLRKDTPSRSIYEYVDQDMKEMSPINRMITKWSMVRLKSGHTLKKILKTLSLRPVLRIVRSLRLQSASGWRFGWKKTYNSWLFIASFEGHYDCLFGPH